MRFSEIHGNEPLKTKLVSMVDQNRLGHALLLAEQDGMGAFAFAIALAQYLFCTNPETGSACGICPGCHKAAKLIHPDLHFAFPVNATSALAEKEKKAPVSQYFLEPFRQMAYENPYFDEQDLHQAIGLEGKAGQISVNEAKSIMEQLSLRPYEANYKVMIIYLAEKMNAEAANKLLKLLEEPPAGTLFILISHEPDKLLTTIISRCQMIRLHPMDRQQLLRELQAALPEEDPEALEQAAALSQGSWGRALKLVHDAGGEAEFNDLLHDMFDAALSKSLSDMMPVWEQIAGYGRDRQKEFCLYAEQFIRKIYMEANGAPELSLADSGQKPYIQALARKIRPEFYQKAIKAFDSAIGAVQGNVSAKLTFCDLCNRIYLYI